MILFFNKYFKIYKIFKKNLVKINYCTDAPIDYLNFLELSPTEFLLNKGNEFPRPSYQHMEIDKEKAKNILTKKFTLDNNKRYTDKETPNFPFGKILKFKDTFILIQTYYCDGFSGRFMIEKRVYLNLNNNYILILFTDHKDVHKMPQFEIFNEDLYLFYNRGIHKFFVDINNLKNVENKFSWELILII